jgi:hypothetical protein
VRALKYAYWALALVGLVAVFYVFEFGLSTASRQQERSAINLVVLLYGGAASAGYWLLLRLVHLAKPGNRK